MPTLPSQPASSERGREGAPGAPARDRARRRRRSSLWAAVAVVVVAGLAVGGWAWQTARDGGWGGIGFNGSDPPFSLSTKRVTAVSMGGKRIAAPRPMARPVARTLSALYGGLFLDPDAWEEGPTSEAWSSFSRDAMARAREDIGSFSLGDVGPRVETLDVTRSRLDVRLLLDDGNRVLAAFAAVRFSAAGELSDGRRVNLRNRASYILRPIGGRWVVVGYPVAETKVKTRRPKATPSAAAAT